MCLLAVTLTTSQQWLQLKNLFQCLGSAGSHSLMVMVDLWRVKVNLDSYFRRMSLKKDTGRPWRHTHLCVFLSLTHTHIHIQNSHQLRLLQVVFAYRGHELQVFVLLLQRHHFLLSVLQLLLSSGQLVPQPLVLLTQTAHLRRRRHRKWSVLKVNGPNMKEGKDGIVDRDVAEGRNRRRAVKVEKGLTWARSFCFSASSEPRWADRAIMTWRRETQEKEKRNNWNLVTTPHPKHSWRYTNAESNNLSINNVSPHWVVYLRLAEPQLYPVQRLADDATFLLVHAVALRRGPTLLLRRLQTLQQAAVLSSQRLQPWDHLLRVAQNLLRRQHRCRPEVSPSHRSWPRNTHGSGDHTE